MVWKKEVKRKIGVQKSSSAMEQPCNSELADRVHFHWKVDLADAIDHTTVNAFRFHGVGPDARCKAFIITVIPDLVRSM